MTTIVCNKEEMAGDLQITISGQVKSKAISKVFMIPPHELHSPEPFIVGICGNATDILSIVDYYSRPEVYKTSPKIRGSIGLVLTKSGRIFTFDTVDKWIEHKVPFMSVGSGSTAALGAMHMGASPKNAIKAAMKVDPYTGMGTKSLKF